MLRADDSNEPRLAEAVAQALREEDIGMAFGALASGADIVIAEQALALGAELHVVFPFDRDDFVEHSVGRDWRARFDRCAAAATGTYAASPMRYVHDDAQFAFGSRTAMGMARLRAAQSMPRRSSSRSATTSASRASPERQPTSPPGGPPEDVPGGCRPWASAAPHEPSASPVRRRTASGGHCACYVGRLALPKNFGSEPIYSLGSRVAR